MEKFVQIEKVGQTFDTKKGKFVALRDVDLILKPGEFVALIGHSGCGKSTLLNLIAGLTKPTSGVLLCDGREIAGPGPERAVVFQNQGAGRGFGEGFQHSILLAVDMALLVAQCANIHIHTLRCQAAALVVELAARLHSYYNAEKFLVEDESVKLARLALILATRQVLKNGLAVLGVSAPEKM